jgi:tetratricopeptide (TPR) repeat protein
MPSRPVSAIVALLVCLSGACLPGRSLAAARPDARAAAVPGVPTAPPSKWTRLRTQNFVLIGENGPGPLRRVAERLEQFREVFARVFPSTRQTMPAPIVVHVFTSGRAYQPFMPLFNGKRVEVGGFFLSTPGAYFITVSLEAGDRAYPNIFHEYVHLLTGNALADVPVWFSEGLAEYYETYELVGQREATLGRVNENHVLSLRERFIPLSELVSVTHDSSLYNEGDRRSIFYAESWALTHYLLIGNPQRKGQLATYLAKYAEGVPNERAFHDAFGATEAELEKELKRYIQGSSYRSTQVQFADKVAIDKDWTVDQPSEADGETERAELLLAQRRYDDAGARVEAVLKTAPDHARALAVLARVRQATGHADEAALLFRRALAAAGDDYLPAYYRAMTLLRPENAPSSVVSAVEAREALGLLKRITTLQPNLADAHGLSAFASLVLDDPRAAMASAAIAFRLSPRHEYALFHARARVRLVDSGVRPALNALVERGSSEWIRKEALNLLSHLAQLERAAPGLAAGERLARDAAADGDGPLNPGGDAIPATPASMRTPRLRPVFRAMQPGEQRELGNFESVECSRAGIVLALKTPDRAVRLSAAAFDRIEFLTYKQEAPGQVACGPRPKPERVYVTYRTGGGLPGTEGTVVAIEMLPDDFKP